MTYNLNSLSFADNGKIIKVSLDKETGDVTIIVGDHDPNSKDGSVNTKSFSFKHNVPLNNFITRLNNFLYWKRDIMFKHIQNKGDLK